MGGSLPVFIVCLFSYVRVLASLEPLCHGVRGASHELEGGREDIWLDMEAFSRGHGMFWVGGKSRTGLSRF